MDTEKKWSDFVSQCKNAVPGSGEKLERIRKNKEAGFNEHSLGELLEMRVHPSFILVQLFSWKSSLEKNNYWRDLSERLGRK
ncbi:hypothetical protein A2442_02985 [Candidatus Campbellbacteria bacterium RIFOXYC2_FULL_35_25]|uniref:Uncharacterized protein n=1 Tax=Candidatus Campbellbacteria bacterium RIFOXYC2_FULL_35_25 TaxID=1797582 RepID=A0A1F5EJR6_9BACT|nr:MAG: hypothetical protein A2442_02985 [Candidatus Campbellbacteria bacterium RIFOXYC2_FULL_35_25]